MFFHITSVHICKFNISNSSAYSNITPQETLISACSQLSRNVYIEIKLTSLIHLNTTSIKYMDQAVYN